MKNFSEECDEVQPVKLKEALKEHNIPFEEEHREDSVVIKINPKTASSHQGNSSEA